MDILDDIGVSKLSAKVFSKVNFFNVNISIFVFALYGSDILSV